MNVEMLLVDKGSKRYRRQDQTAQAYPDVVISLKKGVCAHYHYAVNQETQKTGRFYCIETAATDRGNGLLCERHQQMLFPFHKKGTTAPGLIDAADLVRRDKRKSTDLVLHNPAAMRSITNKRPADDWKAPIETFVNRLKAAGATRAAVQKIILEDLEWDLFDARSVKILTSFPL